jgi:hypothetical protein
MYEMDKERDKGQRKEEGGGRRRMICLLLYRNV